MKRMLVLSLAASMALPVVTAPTLASAQSRYEDCRHYERKKANNGAVIGGLGGALAGVAIAGRGNNTEGALLGGAVGAVAGHQIAKKNVKCAPYRGAATSSAPRRAANVRTSSSASSNCRWVQERHNGRDHSYQVCRGRDGVWRPS